MESKALWLFALAAVVFVINTVIEANSPPSRGSLNATLDDLDLPFFEEVSRSTSGSSTCRPKCPQVERTWLAPSAAPEAAMAAAAGALSSAGYLDDARDVFSGSAVPERFRLEQGNEVIVVETERKRRSGEATQVFLTIRLIGSR